MKALLIAASLAVATPALAQLPAAQVEELRMQQQAADRRAIDQSNQAMAAEARMRADQAAVDLQAQRNAQALPELRYDPPARSASAVAPIYPKTPDAALADSNKRVQAAARPR